MDALARLFDFGVSATAARPSALFCPTAGPLDVVARTSTPSRSIAGID